MNRPSVDCSDTICAVATAPGPAGVGIVRVSGPAVEQVAMALIGKLPEPRHATLARFMAADGRPIDTGLALYFPGPDSFTGESVLELQAHGSPVVLEQLLRAAVAAGARRAGPGEFSQRAFLNDKLDLTQAEAIADLIAAGSERAARAAQRSLAGEFSRRVHALAEAMTTLRVWLEAALDFPDEDIDFMEDQSILAAVNSLIGDLRELIREAASGRVLTDGLKIAIVGRPNAGKSSLFNALLQRAAAIVTEQPGTTRDVLRESMVLGGIPAQLADTAGLRDSADAIEREGVRRAQVELQAADLVFWVTDSSAGDPGKPPPVHVPLIRIDNKIDLVGLAPGLAGNAVRISALSGAGLPALDQKVRELFGLDQSGAGEFSARAHQVEALEAALGHMEAGAKALGDRAAGELLAEELREAANRLGEITGRLTPDELLGRIFAGFCIGK